MRLTISPRLAAAFICFVIAAACGPNPGPEQTDPPPAQSAAPANPRLPDWPCWRGPEGDGIARETDFDPRALDGVENLLSSDHPRMLWRQKIGKGYSGISVAGKYLYTMGYERGKTATWGLDSVYCLDADSGELVWSLSYACSLSEYSGPRAAPLVADGLVYTVSHDGHLYCLDAVTGAVVWFVDVARRFGTVRRDPEFGFCAPPVIHDEVLLLNAHEHGIAFDKNTGALRWESPNEMAGYAPPVVFEYGNGHAAAVFGARKLFIVNIGSGNVIAAAPWPTHYECNIADPVIDGNKIFVSSSYDQGCGLFTLENGTLNLVWSRPGLGHQMAPGVLIDGYYYGNDYWYYYDKGEFRCIEFATGKPLWELHLGMGSIMAVNKTLLILTETGRLLFANASPAGFNTISSVSLGKGRRGNWFTPPTVVRSRLYLRNYDGDIFCLDMAKK